MKRHVKLESVLACLTILAMLGGSWVSTESVAAGDAEDEELEEMVVDPSILAMILIPIYLISTQNIYLKTMLIILYTPQMIIISSTL